MTQKILTTKLFDQNTFDTKMFLDQTRFLIQEIIFGQKNSGSQQILGSKRFWVPKNCGSWNIFGLKKSGSRKNLVRKKIRVPIKFGPEKFWVLKIMGYKKIRKTRHLWDTLWTPSRHLSDTIKTPSRHQPFHLPRSKDL